MSKNYCLTGTGPSLEIGKGNALLKADGTGLAARLNDDSAYANFKVATPVASEDAATKAYVDGLANGVNWLEHARVCTAVALPANTQGTPNTLTANANGSINSTGIDGVTTLVVGDRVLVDAEGDATKNGVYEITDLGSAGTPWVFTRTADAQAGTDATADALFISEGNTCADTAFVQTADGALYQTNATTWVQFSSVAYTAGDGIQIIANVISVFLFPSGGLDFNTDIIPGRLQIAALGVTTGKLADAAVTDIKRDALTGLVVRYAPFTFASGTVPLLDGGGLAPLETGKNYLTLKTMICVEVAFDDVAATAVIQKVSPAAVVTTIQDATESDLLIADTYNCDNCDFLASGGSGWTYQVVVTPGASTQGSGRAMALAVKLD